jgi:hypothetical protein
MNGYQFMPHIQVTSAEIAPLPPGNPAPMGAVLIGGPGRKPGVERQGVGNVFDGGGRGFGEPDAVLNEPEETGVYYDERGRPMLGSTLVHDPEFQDRVVAETRALLSTVSALQRLPALSPRRATSCRALVGHITGRPGVGRNRSEILRWAFRSVTTRLHLARSFCSARYSWTPTSMAAVFSRHAAVPRDDDAGHLRRPAAALTIAQPSRSQPPGLVLRLPDS